MKPVTLRARWTGSPPAVGHWLKAPKGRTAYEVTATRRIDPRKNAKRYGILLTCVRHPPADIPAGAIVHDWAWDRRERTRRAI